MNIKRIIKVISLIIIIVIAGFIFAYFSDLSIVDPILPSQLREQRILERAKGYFPNSIGAYSLIGEPDKKVEVKSLCNKIENNPILAKTGKTGDTCMETFSATYSMTISSTTATTTSKLVRVDLSKFTKAVDSLKLLVEKTTNPDKLNGQVIFRTTVPFRLGWSPLAKFDLIMTDEGELAVTSTTRSMKFEGTALGNNDVAKYFMSKYPSGK
ncbi:MAG: hypothetical protein WC666_04440 [Candidatus Paceibacterota bacterium]